MTEWIEANPLLIVFWGAVFGFGLVALAKLYGFVFMRGRSEHMIGSAMAGHQGTVAEWNGDSGLVSVGGELWKAASSDALAPGDRIRVKAVKGLMLEVSGKH